MLMSDMFSAKGVESLLWCCVFAGAQPVDLNWRFPYDLLSLLTDLDWSRTYEDLYTPIRLHGLYSKADRIANCRVIYLSLTT